MTTDPAAENRSDAFERLPATAATRTVRNRPTRAAVIDYWVDRFGVPEGTFDGVTFFEKGAGRIWALSHELSGPVAIEALGLPILRTRQEFWKPTTDGARRFGAEASDCVIHLDRTEAKRFLAGEEQELTWDGDWGYLIATHDIAGGPEPIGVGLFTYGTLQSMIPKGRRREFR
ncbi:MAG: hypothetical protein ABEJ84_04065 [Halodesulfurarchaeum sp.]